MIGILGFMIGILKNVMENQITHQIEPRNSFLDVLVVCGSIVVD